MKDESSYLKDPNIGIVRRTNLFEFYYIELK